MNQERIIILVKSLIQKIVTRLLKQKDKNLWIDSLLKYRFIKQMSLMTLNMKIV